MLNNLTSAFQAASQLQPTVSTGLSSGLRSALDFGEQYNERAQKNIESERAWSAEQAQKQMDFQREMSNTTYQRAMADIQKAGLNPMLLYQQGGAPASAGAMGSTSPQQQYSKNDKLEATLAILSSFTSIINSAIKAI